MSDRTLDELMSLDPLEMTAEDIDSIIAQHRQYRANAAGGAKAKKEGGPKLSLDGIAAKMLPPKPSASVPRRGM